MSDQDLQAICDRMQQYFLGKTQAISCKLGDDVVQEHTKILATLQADVSHILSGIVDINSKLETQAENHNDNTDRITKIETRESSRKDYLATLIAIAAALIAAIPYVGKLVK